MPACREALKHLTLRGAGSKQRIRGGTMSSSKTEMLKMESLCPPSVDDIPHHTVSSIYFEKIKSLIFFIKFDD